MFLNNALREHDDMEKKNSKILIIENMFDILISEKEFTEANYN